jgi:hypothetical protein
MMWNEELRKLVEQPFHHRLLEHAVQDAKSRLRLASFHDPLVASVSDRLFHSAITDRHFIQEHEYYALLAFELLKQNVELRDRILETVRLQPGPILTPKGDVAL